MLTYFVLCTSLLLAELDSEITTDCALYETEKNTIQIKEKIIFIAFLLVKIIKNLKNKMQNFYVNLINEKIIGFIVKPNSKKSYNVS